MSDQPPAADADVTPTIAVPAHIQPPTQLSEVDRLRLQLMKEKRSRMHAEGQNLQMAQRAFEAQFKALEVESKVFFDALKTAYRLEAGDEISEDGAIRRRPAAPLPQ